VQVSRRSVGRTIDVPIRGGHAARWCEMLVSRSRATYTPASAGRLSGMYLIAHRQVVCWATKNRPGVDPRSCSDTNVSARWAERSMKSEMRHSYPRALVRALAVVIAMLMMVSGCSRPRHAAGLRCVADSVAVLQRPASVPSCARNELPCRLKCMAGNSASCLGLAYEAEKDPTQKDETVRLFRRACLLGAANACTNYAASIWAAPHAESELTCARRTFEKACSAKEPYACGMVGRLMIENASPPAFAEGRKYLEHACEDVGGFPCRVLARHLESGKLGRYERGSIHVLLRKACADGDDDACGEPATASETFH
jgi:hypothetical protein